MVCIAKNERGADVLMDYCAGTLDPAQVAGLEEHLRECSGCRELIDAQRSLWQTLDAWTPVEVSPDFDAKLYARISQQQAEPWHRRLFQFPTPLSFWKPALSIGAVAAALTVVAVMRTPDTPAVVTPAPVVQAKQQAKQSEGINIQEVQQALDDLNLLTPAGTSSPL